MLVDPKGREWGTWPSEQTAHEHRSLHHRLRRVKIERRSNVVPACFGLDSCHDRCHTEAGFEEKHDVARIARRFGEQYAGLYDEAGHA